MTAVVTRRVFLLLGASTALVGCGFQPVYMRTASGRGGPAERDLAAVNILQISERPGMLMRQALLTRFTNPDGDEVPHRYDLTVSYWMTGAGIGMLQDTVVTRIRLTGNANWTLNALDPGHTMLTSGTAHALDSFNNLDSQIFASDLEVEALQKQLAEALADQITLQLAAYFRKRAATGAAS